MFDNLFFQYELASSIVCVRARRDAMEEIVATAALAIKQGYEPCDEQDLWSYLFFWEEHYRGEF